VPEGLEPARRTEPREPKSKLDKEDTRIRATVGTAFLKHAKSARVPWKVSGKSDTPYGGIDGRSFREREPRQGFRHKSSYVKEARSTPQRLRYSSDDVKRAVFLDWTP